MRVKIGLQSIKSWRGQSFVELAIILPALLFILLGFIEVAFFLGRYMDILDLTREAARFASIRDPYSTEYDFYFNTALLGFSPPEGSCTDPAFCGGINRYVALNNSVDDIVISVFTVTDYTTVTEVGLWAFSGASANYTKDCQGNPGGGRHFDAAVVADKMSSGTMHDSVSALGKGFVAVESFYCYHQVLGLGTFVFIPNPVRIHAYTLFPLPAADTLPASP